MSGIHRAMEKAEREGMLTWTHTDRGRGNRAAAVEDPPSLVSADTGGVLAAEPLEWPAIGTNDGLLNPLLVAATRPTSAAAEQYRLLRTRLEGRENVRCPQFMLVSSPRVGDGKTITSANLALTMAQEFRQKVVLVDADLRRPMLAEMFGVPAGPGLIDVLVGATPLDDALIAVPAHHLFLLPAGIGASRSTELLASSMMHDVVESLRARFSRIIVDTPPVALADTHVLARLADGLLIVVRAGVTSRTAVERALGEVDRQRLLGLVLNGVDETSDEYGYADLCPQPSDSED
jgi:capsular exopolysaccharide synthesis family protein